MKKSSRTKLIPLMMLVVMLTFGVVVSCGAIDQLDISKTYPINSGYPDPLTSVIPVPKITRAITESGYSLEKVSSENPMVIPTQRQTSFNKSIESIPLISEEGYQDYKKKIEKSNLTSEDKSYYQELLKLIKDNSSSLSKEEQFYHIIDIAYVDHPEDLKQDKQMSELKARLKNVIKPESNQDLFDTDNSTEEPLLQWTGIQSGSWGAWSHTGYHVGDVHNYMAYNAGKYVGFSDYWSDRLGAEASDPDISIFDQYYHYIVNGVADKAYDRAQDAIAACYAGLCDPWVTNLAWCMHYESDAASPFHYNLDYLDLHSAYEGWVGDKWSNSGWKSYVTSDPYYYHIYSPRDGAINLGNEAHRRYVDLIFPIMRMQPENWKYNQAIMDETKHMLIEAQRHNRGLIYYCRPPT